MNCCGWIVVPNEIVSNCFNPEVAPIVQSPVNIGDWTIGATSGLKQLLTI
jgi:hypothetical protein